MRDRITLALLCTIYILSNVIASDTKEEVKVKDVGFSTSYIPPIQVLLGFLVICIASSSLGDLAPKLSMPLITGYLVSGILAGPYILDLIPKEHIRSLRFVDELSLSYIALTAGSKFYFPKMLPVGKSIFWIAFALVVLEYIVGTLTVLVGASAIPILKDFSFPQQLAVALLAGTMMIARSPSSALALVSELRAQGRFTNIVLGVTIVCDIVVILFYNLNDLLAAALLSHSSSNGWIVILEFLSQIALSFLGGILFGVLLVPLVFWPLRAVPGSGWHSLLTWVKCGLLLGACGGVFILSHTVEPFIDPLLFCLVSGSYVVNYTNANDEFLYLLKKLDLPVYVGFFTLTGAALELDVLQDAIAVSCLLCFTRVTAILFGSMLGNVIVKESNVTHSSYMWTTYITQAGVTLGLAKRVHLEFPMWGGYFATIIVACVIINQLIGPPLLRYGLSKSGDVPIEGSLDTPGVVVVDGDIGEASCDSVTHILKVTGWKVARVVSKKRMMLPDEVEVEVAGVDEKPNLDKNSSSTHMDIEMTSTRRSSTVIVSEELSQVNNVDIDENPRESFGGEIETEIDIDDADDVNLMTSRSRFPLKGYCNGNFDWLIDHFTPQTAASRMFGGSQEKDSLDGFIYTLLKLKQPVDSFIVTSASDEDDLLQITGSVSRCHKIIAGNSFRPLRIVVMLDEIDDEHQSRMYEKLSFIPKETNTVGLVSISVVNQGDSTVNLLDLAVRGGTMSKLLDVTAYVERSKRRKKWNVNLKEKWSAAKYALRK